MKTKNTNRNCRTIRGWLYNIAGNCVGLNAQWVQSHIAHCTKCQQRLASVGKVNLALSIIKSEPHHLDLLMRANAKAVGVLKHSLRYSPKAEKLKKVLPEPALLERIGRYKQPVVSAAACMAILLLLKTGIFSSMSKFQSEGQKAVEQYYAKQVGPELTDEIFHA